MKLLQGASRDRDVHAGKQGAARRGRNSCGRARRRSASSTRSTAGCRRCAREGKGRTAPGGKAVAANTNTVVTM